MRVGAESKMKKERRAVEDQSRRESRELKKRSLPLQLCARAAKQLCTLMMEVWIIYLLWHFLGETLNFFFFNKFRFGLLQEDLMYMYQKKNFLEYEGFKTFEIIPAEQIKNNIFGKS